jgi:hypothetical protein
VPHVRITSSRGPRIFDGDVRRYRLTRRLLRRALNSGVYRLHTYQRPCNGNCSMLERPINRCSARFRIRGSQRATATIRLISARECEVVLG